MPAIVNLIPITRRGVTLLREFETKTGLLPFETNDASGAKTYYLQASANVDGFQAALDRIEPKWITHLTFKDLTGTE